MFGKAKSFIKTFFPALYNKLYIWKIKYVTEKKRKVSFLSYGEENSDKVFYVIRWQGKGPAWAGLVNVVLSGCAYAQEHGYIPVVDFQNAENAYLPPDKVGTENVWEWFFEQPAGYSLSDIQHSRNICLSPTDVFMDEPFQNTYFEDIEANEKAYIWKERYHKYIRMNNVARDLCRRCTEQYLLEKQRTLGVKLRGTDYFHGFQGHPKQISLQTCIDEVRAIMVDYGFQQIFLSCEDAAMVQQFRAAFPEKVTMSEEANKKVAQDGVIHAQEDAHKDLEDYLTSIWMLAQCGGFYGVACGGTMLSWYGMEEAKKYFHIAYAGVN